jgi:prepilin-type N-terminal cleavage/methylation domain-containing protein/prepilin-type processing-associated H-X9-DG protein
MNSKARQIVNRKSSIDDRSAFTLIELLVVISIVALLTAILIPTLHRVRKQARAVVCQATLRQWSVLLATYAGENHGRLPEPPTGDTNAPRFRQWWAWGWGWGWSLENGILSHDRVKDMLCCPMAAKPANPTGTWGQCVGGTFLAWGPLWPEGLEPIPGFNLYGSYGSNSSVANHWCSPSDEVRTKAWRTADVRGADRIPVYFDNASDLVYAWRWDLPGVVPEPPAHDAIPTGISPPSIMSPCMNRHDGGINVSFLDWSVRKVGLKELWTLKWNRQYNVAGKWTKAGGVQAEDWPQWMRGFKEY